MDGEPRTFMAWEWHNASHLYRAAVLPGKAGAILLLIIRVLALLLFMFGLCYSAFAERVGVEQLNPKYFTCAHPTYAPGTFALLRDHFPIREHRL